MKKLFLFLAVAAAFILAAFFLVNRLFTSSPPAGEPYELTQARAAAQVADLQRDAANADFWNGFLHWAAIVILLLIVVVIFAAMLLLFAVVAHRLRMERARLEKELNTFGPDNLGNYPAVILDNVVHQLQPGNAAWPDPGPTWIIGNSPAARLPPGRSRYDIPMIVNTGGQRLATPGQPLYMVEDREPGQLEAGELDNSVQIQEIQANSVQEFGELLARAKAGGHSKNASIKEITGVAHGGSRAFKAYSDYWDSLQ